MEEEYKGYEFKIEQDEDADSPRNWDNLGTMVCWHRNYDLGDKEATGILTPREFVEWADGNADIAVILPLFLYDHSGLRMKVGSFAGLLPQGHAEWDTMQVGWIYVTKEALRKEYSCKRVTAKVLAQARKVLEGEVETYDQYLSGDVWGYVIDGVADGSCWGFYGYDECLSEAKAVIDAHIERHGTGRAAGPFWADDDGCLASGTGDDYETVAEFVGPKAKVNLEFVVEALNAYVEAQKNK